MAISITFDTIAEMTAYMAAFGGAYVPATLEEFATGGVPQPGEIIGSGQLTGTAITAIPVQSELPIADSSQASAPASVDGGKAVTPEARAAIEAAVVAAEAAKGSRTPKSKPKAKDAAPAPAPAPAPTAEVNGKPAEVLDKPSEDKPAENSAAPAATPPTATEETAPPASSSEDAGFFSSTEQDANATAAPKVYTAEEVKETLMEWSKQVNKETFGAVMLQFKVKSMADLATKPEVFAPMMEIVNASLDELARVAAIAAEAKA